MVPAVRVLRLDPTFHPDVAATAQHTHDLSARGY